MIQVRFLPFAAAALFAVPAPSVDAQPANDGYESVGIFSFVLENDLFYATDRRYTNGARFSYLTPLNGGPEALHELARSLPMFRNSDVRLEFAVGQNMYTATDKLLANPPAGDRPYAGWLYASAGVVASSPGASDGSRTFDQLLVSLGVVGPASLAEHTQDFIHKIVDSPLAQGWDTQLENEPTLQLAYKRSWRSPRFDLPASFAVDGTPHAGIALGNVFTYANTGVMLRLGQNLPDDYGPPRVAPSLPGSGYFIRPATGFGWYLFGGVDGRAVAHNIFLDGNTFGDSRSVDKRRFVGDVQFGLAMVIENTRVAYTHVVRTDEYDGQRGGDAFGALSLSVKF